MNPTAIVFWAVCAGAGYLWDGWHGALVGGVSALATSLVVDIHNIFTRR